MNFHPSIVYVDESGDHGPVSPEYPIFVLAFCIFDKAQYADDVARQMQHLKFKYFGHDAVVLHEREIRKTTGPFAILHDRSTRHEFLTDLTTMIAEAPFELVAAAIRKDRLLEHYAQPRDVYHLAMQFGLERIAMHFMLEENHPPLHVVCEGRGRVEDAALELAFRRACDADGNALGKPLSLQLVLAPKHGNYCGMQFADLIARPIGRHVLDPEQPNQAWETIQKKFRRSDEGRVEGWGLKVFP